MQDARWLILKFAMGVLAALIVPTTISICTSIVFDPTHIASVKILVTSTLFVDILGFAAILWRVVLNTASVTQLAPVTEVVKPLEYAALLDESVLHRQRGDRSVMRAQLQRLADISQLSNVTIQILRLKRNHGLAVDSFSIFQFGSAHDTILHNVVGLEHLSLNNKLYVEGDTDTHQFRLAFNHLARNASLLRKAES